MGTATYSTAAIGAPLTRVTQILVKHDGNAPVVPQNIHPDTSPPSPLTLQTVAALALSIDPSETPEFNSTGQQEPVKSEDHSRESIVLDALKNPFNQNKDT